MPGRLSEEMMAKLQGIQEDKEHDYFVPPNVLFPGLSLCYGNVFHACVVLQRDQETSKSPCAVFEIEFEPDIRTNFLHVHQITHNKSDEGTFIANRLVIRIDSVKKKSLVGYAEPVIFVKAVYIDPENNVQMTKDSWIADASPERLNHRRRSEQKDDFSDLKLIKEKRTQSTADRPSVQFSGSRPSS